MSYLTSDEIDKRLKNIKHQFESPDVEFQATALEAFNNLASMVDLTSEMVQDLVPFVMGNIGSEDSSLRTVSFKSARLIGIIDFSLIKKTYPLLFEELKVKNRFRTAVVMDMLYDLENADIPIIKDSIKELLNKSPEWFEESFLKPILTKFWEKSTKGSFQFIDNYKTEIETAIETYPEGFSDLKVFISDSIKDYEKHMEELKVKKKKEEKLKAEQRKARELEKKKEEKKRKEFRKMVKESSKDDQAEEGVESLEEEEDYDDAKSSYPTFTSLGLKRKEPEDDD